MSPFLNAWIMLMDVDGCYRRITAYDSHLHRRVFEARCPFPGPRKTPLTTCCSTILESRIHGLGATAALANHKITDVKGEFILQ
ncbi:hypothetical protein K443DRAFT_671465 [Laccaria amethystina LaAM-08-1]|uniref:Uncharacterized protein n=1 Tax=Laccaria amethystina LaAM-08-1 TaxID=1095629 RepID=A0A0C9XBD2_9AGAR|nr:hypothetical protein K443DRAFT_671465 [Laccaria amethystina LaAM-08-1]